MIAVLAMQWLVVSVCVAIGAVAVTLGGLGLLGWLDQPRHDGDRLKSGRASRLGTRSGPHHPPKRRAF